MFYVKKAKKTKKQNIFYKNFLLLVIMNIYFKKTLKIIKRLKMFFQEIIEIIFIIKMNFYKELDNSPIKIIYKYFEYEKLKNKQLFNENLNYENLNNKWSMEKNFVHSIINDKYFIYDLFISAVLNNNIKVSENIIIYLSEKDNDWFDKFCEGIVTLKFIEKLFDDRNHKMFSYLFMVLNTYKITSKRYKNFSCIDILYYIVSDDSGDNSDGIDKLNFIFYYEFMVKKDCHEIFFTELLCNGLDISKIM